MSTNIQNKFCEALIAKYAGMYKDSVNIVIYWKNMTKS